MQGGNGGNGGNDDNRLQPSNNNNDPNANSNSINNNTVNPTPPASGGLRIGTTEALSQPYAIRGLNNNIVVGNINTNVPNPSNSNVPTSANSNNDLRGANRNGPSQIRSSNLNNTLNSAHSNTANSRLPRASNSNVPTSANSNNVLHGANRNGPSQIRGSNLNNTPNSVNSNTANSRLPRASNSNVPTSANSNNDLRGANRNGPPQIRGSNLNNTPNSVNSNIANSTTSSGVPSVNNTNNAISNSRVPITNTITSLASTPLGNRIVGGVGEYLGTAVGNAIGIVVADAVGIDPEITIMATESVGTALGASIVGVATRGAVIAAATQAAERASSILDRSWFQNTNLPQEHPVNAGLNTVIGAAQVALDSVAGIGQMSGGAINATLRPFAHQPVTGYSTVDNAVNSINEFNSNISTGNYICDLAAHLVMEIATFPLRPIVGALEGGHRYGVLVNRHINKTAEAAKNLWNSIANKCAEIMSSDSSNSSQSSEIINQRANHITTYLQTTYGVPASQLSTFNHILSHNYAMLNQRAVASHIALNRAFNIQASNQVAAVSNYLARNPITPIPNNILVNPHIWHGPLNYGHPFPNQFNRIGVFGYSPFGSMNSQFNRQPSYSEISMAVRSAISFGSFSQSESSIISRLGSQFGNQYLSDIRSALNSCMGGNIVSSGGTIYNLSNLSSLSSSLSSLASILASTSLITSYNLYNSAIINALMSSYGYIGGVAAEISKIQTMENSVDELMLYDQHMFAFESDSAEIPFSNDELSQIMCVVEKGINKGASPFISIQFNEKGELYTTMNPVYEGTIVGNVILKLDYFLKAYANGGTFPDEFIDNWHITSNTDREYLKANWLDIKDICKAHNSAINYFSLRELMCRNGVETSHSETDSINSVSGNNFRSSLRIIAYQQEGSIKKHSNLFIIKPSFRAEYTIDLMPDYEEYLEKYKQINGEYPKDYALLIRLYDQFKEEIETNMPKIPFCQKLFKKLAVINFFCYYFETLKDMSIEAELPKLNNPYKTSYPIALPPLPVKYYETCNIKITLGSIVEKILSKEASQFIDFSQSLNGYLYNYGWLQVEDDPKLKLTNNIKNIIQDIVKSEIKGKVADDNIDPEFLETSTKDTFLILSNIAAGAVYAEINRLIIEYNNLIKVNILKNTNKPNFEPIFPVMEDIEQNLEKGIRSKLSRCYILSSKWDELFKPFIDSFPNLVLIHFCEEQYNKLDKITFNSTISIDHLLVPELVEFLVKHKSLYIFKDFIFEHLKSNEFQNNYIKIATKDVIKAIKDGHKLYTEIKIDNAKVFDLDKPADQINFIKKTFNDANNKIRERSIVALEKAMRVEHNNTNKSIEELVNKQVAEFIAKEGSKIKSPTALKAMKDDLEKQRLANIERISALADEEFKKNIELLISATSNNNSKSTILTKSIDENHAKLLESLNKKLKDIEASIKSITSMILQNKELSNNSILKSKYLHSVMRIADKEFITKDNIKIVGGCGMELPNIMPHPIPGGEQVLKQICNDLKYKDCAELKTTKIDSKNYYIFSLALREKELEAPAQTKLDDVINNNKSAPKDLLNRLVSTNENELFQKFADSRFLTLKDKSGYMPIHSAAAAGNIPSIELMLGLDKSLIEAKNSNAYTPLMLAAQNGHAEVVKLLLKMAANPEAILPNGMYPLFMAVQHGHDEVVKVLLTHNVKIDVSKPVDSGDTPLHIAIQSGFEFISLKLIQSGANLEARKKFNGYAPFHNAAEFGQIKIIEAIIATNNFDINSSTSDNKTLTYKKTALHIAASYGQIDVINVLIKNGANPDLKNAEGETALVVAINNGYKSIALTLAKITKVNEVNNIKDLASITAAKNNMFEVADLLINRGESISLKNDKNLDYVYYLAFYGEFIRFEKLRKFVNLKSNYDGQTYLSIAAQRGHNLLVDYLQQEKVSYTKSNNDNMLLINHTVKSDNIGDLRSWLKSPYRLKSPKTLGGRHDNKSLAYFAAESGSLYCLKELLAISSSQEITKADGQNHLFISAIRNGDPSIIEAVISYMDNINIIVEPATGNSAAHIAVKYGLIDTVKVLQQNGAVFNIKNLKGHTAYHIAVLNDDKKMLKVLFKLNNRSADWPNDIYSIALNKHKVKCLEFLTTQKFCKTNDDSNKSNVEAFIRACTQGKLNTIIKLLPSVDINECHALHYAIIAGKIDVIKLLLQNNAKHNILHNGFDAFATAVKHDQLQVIKFFHDSGYFEKFGLMRITYTRLTDNKYTLAAIREKWGIIDQATKSIMECVKKSRFDQLSTVLKDFPINTYMFEGEPLTHHLFSLDIFRYANFAKKALSYIANRHGDIFVKDNNGLPLIFKLLKEDNIDLKETVETKLEWLKQIFSNSKKYKPSQYNELINQTDTQGVNIYDAAIVLKKPLLIKNVLENNSLIATKTSHCRLHLAVLSKDLYTVKSVIELDKPYINTIDKKTLTPLMHAAKDGCLDIVEYLLNRGANPDFADMNQNTALHYAVKYKHIDVAKALINSMKNLNKSNRNGVTPLMLAAGNNLIPIVNIFISKTDLISHDIHGKNSIHYAAIEGHLECVKLLIEAGGDVNEGTKPSKKKVETNLTPLCLAAQFGRVQVVDYLLVVPNIDILKEGSRGSNVFKMGVVSNKEAMHYTLCKLKSFYDLKNLYKMLFTAAAVDNIPVLRQLYLMGIKLDSINEKGDNPLHLASLHGSTKAVKFLIEQGLSLELATAQGNRAIHLAAFSGSLNVTLELLNNNVDINVKNILGETALYLAVINGKYETVLGLLMHNADISIVPDKVNLSLAQIALSKGFTTISDLLFIFGDKSIIDSEIKKLDKLDQIKFKDFGKYINGLQVLHDEVNKPDVNPLHVAILMNNKDVVRALCKMHPEYLNQNSSDRGTPLELAKTLSNDELIVILTNPPAPSKPRKTIDEIRPALLSIDNVIEGASLAKETKVDIKVNKSIDNSTKIKQVLDKVSSIELNNEEKSLLKRYVHKIHKSVLISSSQICKFEQLVALTIRLKNEIGIGVFRELFQINKLLSLEESVEIICLILELGDQIDIKEMLKADRSKLKASLEAANTMILANKYPECSIEDLENKFKTISEYVKFPLPNDQINTLIINYKCMNSHATKLKGVSYAKLIDKIISLKKDLNSDLKNDITKQLELVAAIRALVHHHFKIYPYDTQMWVMLVYLKHPDYAKGYISQVMSGEGKSLLIAMIISYHACLGRTIDVITTTHSLARRDQKKFAQFFLSMGIISSHICVQNPTQEQFKGQIIFGTSSDFIFSILRQELYGDKARIIDGVARECDIVAVDEADNFLVKGVRNGSNNLSIPSMNDYSWIYAPYYKYVLEHLRKPFSEKEIRDYLKKLINPKNLNQLDEFNSSFLKTLHKSALTAINYQEGQDYVIEIDKTGERKVVIVDYNNTGKFSKGSRWSRGVHQFVEIKSDIIPKAESVTAASMNNISFFKLYNNIFAWTGTIGELVERNEIKDHFNLEFFDVPPHFPSARTILPPKYVHESKDDKLSKLWHKTITSSDDFPKPQTFYDELINEIKENAANKKPVLVLFRTINDSIKFSQKLDELEIKHQLFNEIQKESEAFILAKAGLASVITIATNNAGRGTDIILSKESKDAGGLHVLLTFLADSNAELQAFARGGRQGQPGSCRMILSSNDPAVGRYINESFSSAIDINQIMKFVYEISLNPIPFLIEKRSQDIIKQSNLRREIVKTAEIRYKIFKEFAIKNSTFKRAFEKIDNTEIEKLCRNFNYMHEDYESKLKNNSYFKFLHDQALTLLILQSNEKCDWKNFIENAKEIYLEYLTFLWGQFYEDILNNIDIDIIPFEKVKLDFNKFYEAKLLKSYNNPDESLKEFICEILTWAQNTINLRNEVTCIISQSSENPKFDKLTETNISNEKVDSNNILRNEVDSKSTEPKYENLTELSSSYKFKKKADDKVNLNKIECNQS